MQVSTNFKYTIVAILFVAIGYMYGYKLGIDVAIESNSLEIELAYYQGKYDAGVEIARKLKEIEAKQRLGTIL